MKLLNLSAVVVGTLLVSGCGDSMERGKQKSLELAEKATGTLARLEAGDLSALDGFRRQVRGLKANLQARDYSRARECAEQIDAFLESTIVSQVVDFLRIESQEGAEKARAAINEFKATHDLSDAELTVFDELHREIAALDEKQIAALVGAIVYLSLERRLSHTAAIPASMAQVLVEEILRDDPSVEPTPDALP